MDDTKDILVKIFMLIGRDGILSIVGAKYDVVQNLAITCHIYAFIGEPLWGSVECVVFPPGTAN